MHVVLINPPNPSKRSVSGAWPPLGLGYLARAATNLGHRSTIIDALVPRISPRRVASMCKRLEPDCVGVSIFSPSLDMSAAIVEAIGAFLPDVTTVGGGPHATLRPAQTLTEMPRLDYVLCGEADESFGRFVLYLDKRLLQTEVPGLAYRSLYGVTVNRQQWPKLATEPERPWLMAGAGRSPYYSMLLGRVETVITSRGCPYSCSFCSKYGQPFRHRSVDEVLSELVNLRRLGLVSVDIFDDTFSAHMSHCLKLLQAIAHEHLGLRFRIRCRPEHVSDDLMNVARTAGVRVVSVGMESGSQKVLESMRKGTSLEAMEKAASTVKRHGLLLTTSWVIGSLGETPGTIQETVEFITRIRPHIATIHKLLPLPDTLEYARAKENGTLQGEWSVGKPQPWIRLPWMRDQRDLEAAVQYVRRKFQVDYRAVANLWLKDPPSLHPAMLGQALRFAVQRLCL